MADRKRWQTIGLWVLSGLLGALFVMSGGSKLAGVQQHVDNFARWGYPDWFRLVVGALEVVAAALLFARRFAFFGALALVIVMAGATYTHLFRATGEGAMAAFTLVLLGLAALVAYVRADDGLPALRAMREP